MFDFDELVDRRGTHSMKWDVAEHELPMWVADMDFRTAPAVRDAIARRVEHGVFGYTDVPAEYPAAVASWWGRRHGWQVDPATVTLTTGVVPAVSSMVRSLSDPGDAVVVMTPVYNVFFASIRNSGRVISESRLVRRDGAYEIDWEDLEARLRASETSLMILCNPQNPTGTIWDRETLASIGALCSANGVSVISDEIHCDLTRPGRAYVPFAAASEECAQVAASCVSPSKAFNLAGLQSAAVVAANPELRRRIVAGFNRDEIAEPNAIAVQGSIAAYTQGEPWLDALRNYLWTNREVATATVNAISGLRAEPGEATYLLWIDASATGVPSGELVARIRETTGLVLSDGESYEPGHSTHLRMNLACPRSRLDDGLDRLTRAMAAITSPSQGDTA